MPSLSPIAVVVFDLDNTLFNRQRAFMRWCCDWARRRMAGLKHEVRQQALRRAIEMDEWGASPQSAIRYLASIVGDDPKQLWGSFQDELSCHVRPDRRVARMLDWIEQRAVMIAIASNGSSKSQRKKISAAKLEQHRWSEVIISGEASVAKPSRAFFVQLQERLQTTPDEMLMVGDDWRRDIQAAAACGWRTCWVAAGRTLPLPHKVRPHAMAPSPSNHNVSDQDRARPTLVLDHVADLQAKWPTLSEFGSTRPTESQVT